MLRYLDRWTVMPWHAGLRRVSRQTLSVDCESAGKKELGSGTPSTPGTPGTPGSWFTDVSRSGSSSASCEEPRIYSEFWYPDRESHRESTPQCNICMDLELKGDMLIIYPSELADLLLSNCSACYMLYTVLKPWEEELDNCSGFSFNLTPKERGLIIWSISPEIDMCLQGVEGMSSCDPSGCINAEMLGYPNPWQPIPERSATRSINSLDVAAQRVSHWLETCKSSHACMQNSAGPLPRRVLNIQAPDKVRLHMSAAGEKECYACLSHRWGGVVPLQLTASTIQEFEEEIAWDSLPATFQDAIEVSRKLNIRYLWIDSLCILQDDPSDWRDEGSKMATIYSGAVLTIAATASPNSTGGLFTSQNYNGSKASGNLPVVHSFNSQDGSVYKICVRSAGDFDFILKENLPLQERAWFFQEWILSPRIVHFADTLLCWECAEIQQTDDGTLFTNRTEAVVQKSILVSLNQTPPEYLSSLSRKGLQTVAWHRLVGSYSSLQLTYPEDIFPALQGITTRMAAKRQCKFFAGLWEDSLVDDLLWWLDEPSQMVDYRAPSWSWASRTSRAVWYTWRWADTECVSPPTRLIPEFSIVSVTTDTVSGNPFGQVSNGTLVLRGLCLPAIFGSQGRHDHVLVPKIKISSVNAREDLSLRSGYDWFPDTHDNPKPDADILVMLTGLWTIHWLGYPTQNESRFLVFRRASDVGDVYERIGVISTKSLAYRVRFLREAIEQELTII
ncbi:hypothetical protein OPT61_g7047 [Boeremia exigua]|uniref:Uncharacterized protein n=1 Tax=Boeremia exigua TaxID=749465 RepID=A0ACC2I4X2_9PLEO|nr:hypothetical protein OPT61_g7047 [Boeremia exigua]